MLSHVIILIDTNKKTKKKPIYLYSYHTIWHLIFIFDLYSQKLQYVPSLWQLMYKHRWFIYSVLGILTMLRHDMYVIPVFSGNKRSRWFLCHFVIHVITWTPIHFSLIECSGYHNRYTFLLGIHRFYFVWLIVRNNETSLSTFFYTVCINYPSLSSDVAPCLSVDKKFLLSFQISLSTQYFLEQKLNHFIYSMLNRSHIFIKYFLSFDS